MPAAAVIPALKAYIMDVAVKKFVVEVEGALGRARILSLLVVDITLYVPCVNLGKLGGTWCIYLE